MGRKDGTAPAPDGTVPLPFDSVDTVRRVLPFNACSHHPLTAYLYPKF